MKRLLVVVVPVLTLFNLTGTAKAQAQQSTLGTCRVEYASWYPSESYKGEPEILLGEDVSQQTHNLYFKELTNRGEELGHCAITANEDPIGANRAFERLSVAYSFAVMKRYVNFLGHFDADFIGTADRKKPVPLFEWLEKLEIASVGALRDYRPYNPLIPFGPTTPNPSSSKQPTLDKQTCAKIATQPDPFAQFGGISSDNAICKEAYPDLYPPAEPPAKVKSDGK
jgi:hypothetical protein